ncbi:lysyl-tRNA synthetase, class II [Geoalkalibacter ferrihydriticus]|uniref:Lysine--tRNA ligase n=2 Tax=Geoalkalibacter ferrihydriticus TaxID=392333 RepID=A0A0C2HFQ2_9BACT|nr:lysine--tRNA ligase [Geoalkalibacter ferrihydriticus]KIH75751.1 lysine--tRNA ligase [Geoalkalibacter ferrihydriticus DSM 17813]SDM63436.1 lysyl-tRNA synthetase, class II [Geoalkalibacter ferrihydriticus]
MEELNDILLQRRDKLKALQDEGVNPFANDFTVRHSTADIVAAHGEQDAATLGENPIEYAIAGRIMARRDFGKAAFVQLQDRAGRLQIYIARDQVGEKDFEIFRKLDLGDLIGITGTPFRTKTDELSLRASGLRLLTKSLRPLPEKWHGLTDVETRYRQRYLDLMVNPQVRDVFLQRSRIISLIREFMQKRDFLEVETPMMQPIAGGATARPFKTYHNTLKMDLFLRIAPELYLKRLVVGGLERVFEINRNFRNEGISIQHNPEFTMMEFYQAYATYEDLMDFTEELICHVTDEVCGSLKISYGGREVDMSPPWKRLSFKEAIVQYGKVGVEILDDPAKAFDYARSLGLDLERGLPLGKILAEIFDEVVEPHLWEPTFITQYPTDISPLSRRNDQQPEVVDRFELFIVGRELANAFSELNDPIDQKERFLQQLDEKEAGDEEAHAMDEDYIRALEYGLPPTAGEGIGIDRLVMLLTDSSSIRDVILFPQLRPEK